MKGQIRPQEAHTKHGSRGLASMKHSMPVSTPSIRGITSTTVRTTSTLEHLHRQPLLSSYHTSIRKVSTASGDSTPSDGGQAQQAKTYTDPRVHFQNAISDDMLVTLSMNFNNDGATHAELCDNLRKNNLISTPLIEYAFRKSDRKFFDPSLNPYEDKPHDIGGGATISSAHMHAITLEALGDAVIPVSTKDAAVGTKRYCDIGSGSGFVTAVFAHIIAALRLNPLHAENAQQSRVVGVEIHPELAAQSIENIRRANPELIDVKGGQHPIIDIVSSDAFSGQIIPHGPFDAIHVGVAAETAPLTILAQLKPGGKCVVPVKIPNHFEQDLMLYTRKTTSTAPLDQFLQEALKTLETQDGEAIRSFTDEHFGTKSLLRCSYISAQTDSTVPRNLPALDPAKSAQRNAHLKKFFDKSGSTGDASPEDIARAQAELKKQQLNELSSSAKQLQKDLDTKQAELDKTSAEIKAWHENYIETHQGKRPSFAEMNSDHYISNLLRIVKALRTQIAKLERSLSLVQDEKKGIDA